MARQAEGKEAIRSLTIMGGGRSLGLTLPSKIVKELKLAPRQKVRVTRRLRQIIVDVHK